ncbi:hypothetical protein OV142_01965 [Nannocystis sp. SCPEA4]|nr:hypothetical protein [Nannocystis sp. SCPEA4]
MHLNLWLLTAAAAAVACDPSDSFSPKPEPSAGAPGPAALAAPEGGGQLCGEDIALDLRRSLVLSEFTVMEPFTFTRVVEQILATSPAPNVTPTQLYQRWWDFFNEGPGLHPDAFHCDDELVDGSPAMGAFPHACPRPEGQLADTDPFDDPLNNPDSYIALGVFNRFDLAPLDGSNCGEYRIVFAKQSGLFDTNDRNLIIFEATLPNPNPSCGIEGCRPIAQFWADLSQIDDITEIRDRVEDFYFVDAAGAGPVVHADNYGPKGGQIRTNQFMNGPNAWQLRQFEFVHDCGEFACIRPVLLKDNPFPELFQDDSPWLGAEAFQEWFVRQVPNLEKAGSNLFFTTDVGTFASGASNSEGEFDNYRIQAGFGGSFRQKIEDAITVPGLTADNILNRALALSCAGCHEHNNFGENLDFGDGLPWEPSLGFVQISEEFTAEGPFGTRFPLSDAVRFVFLPHRGEVLQNFLAETACQPCNDKGLKMFGPPDPSKFLPDGFDSIEGMTIGGPRRGH